MLNIPHAHKDRPEDAPTNLLGNVVYFELSRAIVVRSVGAPRTRHAPKIGIALSLGFMETQGAYDGQALGEVQSQLPPLEYVGSGQAEEVAGTRVVHVQRRAVEIARPSRPRAYVPALVDEGEMIWVLASRLRVEV